MRELPSVGGNAASIKREKRLSTNSRAANPVRLPPCCSLCQDKIYSAFGPRIEITTISPLGALTERYVLPSVRPETWTTWQEAESQASFMAGDEGLEAVSTRMGRLRKAPSRLNLLSM